MSILDFLDRAIARMGSGSVTEIMSKSLDWKRFSEDFHRATLNQNIMLIFFEVFVK